MQTSFPPEDYSPKTGPMRWLRHQSLTFVYSDFPSVIFRNGELTMNSFIRTKGISVLINPALKDATDNQNVSRQKYFGIFQPPTDVCRRACNAGC